jgi:hypothetical protein
MSDLREQLSTRLLMCFGEGRARHMQPDGTVNVVAVWNCVADECIRQMTWVAYEATFSHRASEGYDDKDDALKAAKDFVSLAPEDWKP